MIDLPDAKRHLNVTTTDDDALIQDKLDASIAFVALYTGTTYPLQTDAEVDDDGNPLTTDPTPAPVKEACRQLVAHLYANREASLVGVTAQALPLGFFDLLAGYRAFAF